MAVKKTRKPHPSWCGGVQGEKHEAETRMDKNHLHGLGCTPAPEGHPAWEFCYHRSFCSKCGKLLSRRVAYCPTLEQYVG